MNSLKLNLEHFTSKISDRDFLALCRDNSEARLELDCAGSLIFMSPTGSESGKKMVIPFIKSS